MAQAGPKNHRFKDLDARLRSDLLGAIDSAQKESAKSIYDRFGLADSEMWRQEFLCEFLGEATAFLTYDMIAACESIETACIEPDFKDLAEFKGDLYVGMDIGRLHDVTVFWLLKRDGDRLVTVGVLEQAQQRFRSQYETLAQILNLPSLRRCCIDATGLGMTIAESTVEDFGGHLVEGVTFTPAVKQELAGGLRIRVEERSIVIPASEVIRNDWHSITKLVTSAGNVRYRHRRERTPTIYWYRHSRAFRR